MKSKKFTCKHMERAEARATYVFHELINLLIAPEPVPRLFGF
jgi:hypothetical protein